MSKTLFWILALVAVMACRSAESEGVAEDDPSSEALLERARVEESRPAEQAFSEEV